MCSLVPAVPLATLFQYWKYKGNLRKIYVLLGKQRRELMLAQDTGNGVTSENARSDVSDAHARTEPRLKVFQKCVSPY